MAWKEAVIVRERVGWMGFVWELVRTRTSMFVHHFGILLIGFPSAVWWRGERGDFFLGCLFMAEFVVPFIAVRAILRELELKQSRLYTLNGITMLVVFFIFRICLFPYMFSAYAEFKRVSLWLAPKTIPFGCLASTGALFLLQLYWFAQMLHGAKKVPFSFHSPPLQLLSFAAVSDPLGQGLYGSRCGPQRLRQELQYAIAEDQDSVDCSREWFVPRRSESESCDERA